MTRTERWRETTRKDVFVAPLFSGRVKLEPRLAKARVGTAWGTTSGNFLVF
jgi:hypothetical protein